MYQSMKKGVQRLASGMLSKIQKYVGTPQFQEKSKIALLMYI